MSLFLEVLTTLILSCGEMYTWKNILKSQKIDYRKFFISLLILIFIQIFNYYFISNFMKSIIVMVSFVLLCSFIFKVKLKHSIIVAFICELLIIIIEAFLAIVYSLIFKINLTSNSLFIATTLDLLIAFFIIIISKLKIFNKLYLFIVEITNHIKSYQILLFLLLVMLSSSAIFAYIYLDKNIPLILIINVSISLLYSVIVIIVFKYQNRYYKIHNKYNNTLDILQSQEHIINDYRIMNHENKNQLITIKAMTNSKKIIGYINSLISQKSKFKNEIINESLKLPEGGIRGLIYSKIVFMKDNGIICNLSVDKRITAKKLSNISDNDTVEICEIIGVIIDNAIEEVVNLSDKLINVDMSIIDNEFVIYVSNSYNSVNLNQINGPDCKSIKGKNRGYGLKLANKIVEENRKLKLETIISKETYTQKLTIKL